MANVAKTIQIKTIQIYLFFCSFGFKKRNIFLSGTSWFRLHEVKDDVLQVESEFVKNVISLHFFHQMHGTT